MLKNTSEAELLKGSNSKCSMDIDNGNTGDPENISLPYGKGSSNIKLFDRMVKRKFNIGIIPCAKPKESISFYCQLKDIGSKVA